MGLDHRFDDGRVVERSQGAEVDHLRVDAVAGELLGGAEACGERAPERDQRDSNRVVAPRRAEWQTGIGVGHRT